MNIPLVGWCNAHDDSLGGGGGALLSHVRVHLAPAGNPGSRSGYDHQKFSSRGAQLPHGCSTSFQSSERNLHAGTREKPFLFFLKKNGEAKSPGSILIKKRSKFQTTHKGSPPKEKHFHACRFMEPSQEAIPVILDRHQERRRTPILQGERSDIHSKNTRTTERSDEPKMRAYGR